MLPECPQQGQSGDVSLFRASRHYLPFLWTSPCLPYWVLTVCICPGYMLVTAPCPPSHNQKPVGATGRQPQPHQNPNGSFGDVPLHWQSSTARPRVIPASKGRYGMRFALGEDVSGNGLENPSPPSPPASGKPPEESGDYIASVNWSWPYWSH